MTSIGSSFNWLPQPSAWQDLQNWQARMSAANAQYQSSVAGFDDSLLSAPVTQTGSQLQLITQEMVNRIKTEQATAASKAAAQAAATSSTQDLLSIGDCRPPRTVPTAPPDSTSAD